MPNPTKPEQGWAHKCAQIDLGPAQSGNQASLLDRYLIHESFARYGIAHDEARIDILEGLFTAQASLSVSDGDVPFQTVSGRPALMQNFKNVIGQQADQRRHCITNIVIERLDQNSADALAYGIVGVAADGISLGVTCAYRARLEKEADGVWRFSDLWIGMDGYGGNKPKV